MWQTEKLWLGFGFDLWLCSEDDFLTRCEPAPLKHTHPGQLGKIKYALYLKDERLHITEVSKN